MDCCNYVEAYAAGNHFYQQQQQQQYYASYENAGPRYAGYDGTPMPAAAIEAAVRYNGPPPPAYPTDYVYNPKEARLRKAMREQSRELSRRSILQSAIANSNSRSNGANGSSVSVSVSSEFLDHRHHHRRFGCVAASTVSSVPIVPSPIEPHRATEAWFHAAHRPKPSHPGGTSDWYGPVEGDPIERLQAMGAVHQRSFDKSGKDVVRSQATAAAVATPTDCAVAAFSNGGYGTDFVNAGRDGEMRRQDGEYGIAEFNDGQKWHPYQNQNGSGPHAHARMPRPQAQIPGILQSNVRNTNSHGHGHGAWGQFCHGLLPHVPAVTRNVAIRGPRHAVFLRDHLPNRYCGFSDEAPKIPYVRGKLDADAVRASYRAPDHRIQRMIETPVESSVQPTSTTAAAQSENDDGPRWEQNSIMNDMSLESLVPTSTQQEQVLKREIDRESRRSSEKYEPKKRPTCKTPLPGFHQAFGSTEIGKFSRSELFVNMVGENGGVDASTSDSDVSRDKTLDVNGDQSVDVNRERTLNVRERERSFRDRDTNADKILNVNTERALNTNGNRIMDTDRSLENSRHGILDANGERTLDVYRDRTLNVNANGSLDSNETIATTVNDDGAVNGPSVSGVATSSVSATASRGFEADEDADSIAIAYREHGDVLATDQSASIDVYCGQSTTPRWHSPHVGPIGSEI